MKRSVQVMMVITTWALAADCSGKDPDLPTAGQTFQRRYPEYIIRSSRIVKTEDKTKIVALEFDAPNNAKNRGRAELLLEKGTNGSWEIVGEKVNMWKARSSKSSLEMIPSKVKPG